MPRAVHVLYERLSTVFNMCFIVAVAECSRYRSTPVYRLQQSGEKPRLRRERPRCSATFTGPKVRKCRGRSWDALIPGSRLAVLSNNGTQDRTAPTATDLSLGFITNPELVASTRLNIPGQIWCVIKHHATTFPFISSDASRISSHSSYSSASLLLHINSTHRDLGHANIPFTMNCAPTIFRHVGFQQHSFQEHSFFYPCKWRRP
jgi:hypothetical protein